MTIPTLFFSFFLNLFIYLVICLFIYSLIYFYISLFKQITFLEKNSETTKARNLKFGQMIGLYMDLRHCNFGGVTSRGLGHMHPKLMTANFVK